MNGSEPVRTSLPAAGGGWLLDRGCRCWAPLGGARTVEPPSSELVENGIEPPVGEGKCTVPAQPADVAGGSSVLLVLLFPSEYSCPVAAVELASLTPRPGGGSASPDMRRVFRVRLRCC